MISFIWGMAAGIALFNIISIIKLRKKEKKEKNENGNISTDL